MTTAGPSERASSVAISQNPTADAAGGTEPSLGELVSTATKDLSSLIKQEVELAKVEIKRDVAAAGKGAGMFGGAGFAGTYALTFLSIALAFGIGKLLNLGSGFLIVGLLYLIAAGVLALMGKKNLTKVGPPEKTIQTVKDDIAWAKNPTVAPPRRNG